MADRWTHRSTHGHRDREARVTKSETRRRSSRTTGTRRTRSTRVTERASVQEVRQAWHGVPRQARSQASETNMKARQDEAEQSSRVQRRQGRFVANGCFNSFETTPRRLIRYCARPPAAGKRQTQATELDVIPSLLLRDPNTVQSFVCHRISLRIRSRPPNDDVRSQSLIVHSIPWFTVPVLRT